jgi:hypothetical protein
MDKNHYDFERNLLKASSSDTMEDAVKEWAEIVTKEYECKQTCICNRKIKCVIFMYNSLTYKTIMVGTGCFRKFGLNTGCKSIQPVLRNILKDFFEKGEYSKVGDINLYSEYVERKLREHYMSRILFNTQNC